MAVICRNKSYHFGLLNGFKYWHRRMHVHNFKRNGRTIDASGKTIFAQYHKYQPQVLNTNLVHHRTATNYYDDACLCAWHPCGKDTISFRLIVSQHCCLMTVGTPHESRQVEVMLTMVSYRSRDHRRFLSQTSYANISSDILQCSSSLFRSL